MWISIGTRKEQLVGFMVLALGLRKSYELTVRIGLGTRQEQLLSCMVPVLLWDQEETQRQRCGLALAHKFKMLQYAFGSAKIPILNDNNSTGNWAKMAKVAGLCSIGIEVGRRLGFHDVV